MSKIQILKIGITDLETDAIVNAANEHLREGSGVCGAIFTAAGADQLQSACDEIGKCKTGSAVITPGFNLKSKYIIHAVGPRWTDGKHKESQLLSSSYKSALLLATENNCKTIGFPLISAGIYGYPVDKAWKVALQTCLDFQRKNHNDLDITFAVINDHVLSEGLKTLDKLRKENTTQYLNQLDDRSIQNIKYKLSKNKDSLIDAKTHPAAAGLLSVICQDNLIGNLTVDQLISIFDSIFPANILEESWLAKFGDLLIRIIDAVKKKAPEVRAEKYEKYLREVLIPALKKSSQSKDIWDDIDFLVDAYKVCVCLFRYYAMKEKVFDFNAKTSDMDMLNDSIHGLTGAGGGPLGMFPAPFRLEERQYALFLSWVLEELLIKQEDLDVEE